MTGRDPITVFLNRLEQAAAVSPGRLSRVNRKARVSRSVALARFQEEVSKGLRPANRQIEDLLTLNAVRSRSGIAAVTVLTKPYPCPGRCVFCPTEAGVPKSYLPAEPLVQRAAARDYDPHRQVHDRLQALRQTGHRPDKVELIVKGGTWSFYPAGYQEEFIRCCFDAANGSSSAGLREAQERNETAFARIVGLTVETRPDYVTPLEIRRLRFLGVTRVELGVQSLAPHVLETAVRDHGVRQVQEATRLLKEAGFKVAYHMMPNLPGASFEDDLNSFRELFENPVYRPDALKIYPCVVVESAELSRWHKEGRYIPFDDEMLIRLLIQVKEMVPPYVRIERVVRDIAAPAVEAGCRVNNLREEIQQRMKRQGLSCRCIRCREMGFESDLEFRLNRLDYEASGGRELFLSFEGTGTGRLAALVRMRIPSKRAAPPDLPPEWSRAALIRELHTYGRQVPLGADGARGVQHKGLGKTLMAQAERIALEEFGLRRVAVIAGAGVRGYYRRIGYRLLGTYMVKELFG
ncbi:MAG: tRNA uridine(34) 5-carboxymethylaminomethyl modification radical SAM/GNAT enzyme Elp3 [Candidatus Omnitrophica bacterium]|nr:tRNA uridine(34) 5-carboxymethylaminomethyl modification radical SAM/GNAT enzyme Elp3 [Candidatus Omnitrophota bacterium]